MPKINLRLTEEEHEALKAWAENSHRSLQREAVFRLFADHVAPEYVPAVVEVSEAMLDEIKSVPIPKKRLHPCKHHVPPSKDCPYCDV